MFKQSKEDCSITFFFQVLGAAALGKTGFRGHPQPLANGLFWYPFGQMQRK